MKRTIANLVIEDCFDAQVEVNSITKEGISYKIFSYSRCNPDHKIESEGTLNWDEDRFNWYLYDINTISDSLSYRLVLLLSEMKNKPIDDNEFIKFICSKTGLSEYEYGSLILTEDKGLNQEVEISVHPLYEDVINEIGDRFANGRPLLPFLSKTFGYYVQALEEMKEDCRSEDISRFLYRKSKEECLKEAVNKACEYFELTIND